jgi:hypothetical protein
MAKSKLTKSPKPKTSENKKPPPNKFVDDSLDFYTVYDKDGKEIKTGK